MQINNTSTLASLTIDLPPNAVNGDTITIGFLNPVTSLTLTPPAGVAINWTATSIANGGDTLSYQYTNGGWDRRRYV